MRTGIWMASALALAGLGLASCGEKPEQAETAPETPDGISVTDARLMLPAVKGNPGAIYFDIKNDSDKSMMIRTVSVAGAGSAMLHQMGTWNNQPSMDEIVQIAVPPGGGLKFEPGALHVMASDLADTVTAGSTAEVTLTFVGGDKISFPAEVRAAGDER
jgi:copper(I)-binding protein